MTISMRVGALMAPRNTILSMMNLASRSVSLALSTIVSCPRNTICRRTQPSGARRGSHNVQPGPARQWLASVGQGRPL